MAEPRVLLISDATLSADGGGINRTLLNLFSGYPGERFRLCAPEEFLNGNPPVAEFRDSVISYQMNVVPEIRNRLNGVLGPLRNRLNLFALGQVLRVNLEAIEEYAPEVIVSCTNYVEGCIVARQIQKLIKCPTIFYGMDEFGPREKLSWLVGDGYNSIREHLLNTNGLMFVSDELRDFFYKHYRISSRRSLTIRNTVDIPHTLKLREESEGFVLAYAGSIWPMHLDSLSVVARAVSLLCEQGVDIEFIIYCPEKFWTKYGVEFDLRGVRFGGYVPYDRLQQTLSETDLLLVSSSFHEEYEHISRTSFQTKIPDYLITGRPILAHGPSYSVCNMFVQSRGCGFCCETADVVEVANSIAKLRESRTLLREVGLRGLEVARNEFAQETVRRKMREFLSEVARDG